MAGSPSTADIASFACVGDVLVWVGFPREPDEESLIAAVLSHLGLNSTTPCREVGLIDAIEFNQEIDEWTSNGERPPLSFRSKAKAIGMCCRVAAGLEYTPDQNRQWEESEAKRLSDHQRVMELAAMSPPPPTAQTSAASGAKKVSLKIAVQERSDETAVMPFEEVEKARKSYLLTMHTKTIPMEDSPSAEQLSVLAVILAEQCAPYVDFAIFGPFGGRVRKAMSHKGLVFGANGTLVMEEFRGPPSIVEWMACWRVFQTAMIMLKAADHPQLEAYARHIEKLAKQYGQSAWSTLYQAEVRFRREMMERVREEQSRKLDEALEAGGSYPFDPLRPWDRCFEVAVSGRQWVQYWADQVNTPAMMVLVKVASSESFLGGDAQVAHNPASHLATMYSTAVPDAPAVSRRAPGNGGGNAVKREQNDHPGNAHKKAKVAPSPRGHFVAGNAYTANRKGQTLCLNFQQGSCNGRCPQSNAHQCDRCLDPRHGSQHPNQCSSTPKAPKGKGTTGKGNKRK
jgi:hypothetical protein